MPSFNTNDTVNFIGTGRAGQHAIKFDIKATTPAPPESAAKPERSGSQIVTETM